LRMADTEGRPLALFDTVVPATPSGKVELASDVLAQKWGAAARLPDFRPRADEYPLSLISPASDARISSTLLGAGGAAREMPELLMHPDDVFARRLADGSTVRVFNALGTVVLRLRVTDAVARGVVASEKGAWLATSPTGQTISALVSADACADLAEGACYNDTGVEVAAA
jgi:anaerobic selenocysteine-containing dehydrogenase